MNTEKQATLKHVSDIKKKTTTTNKQVRMDATGTGSSLMEWSNFSS